jgi:hypothetical protein
MAMASWVEDCHDLIPCWPDIALTTFVQYVVLLGIRSAQSRPEERRIQSVKCSSHWQYSDKKVGHPRLLNLPATVGIQTRNNYALPTTVFNELADTVELSYQDICALQRYQYSVSGKWYKYAYTVAKDIHFQEG